MYKILYHFSYLNLFQNVLSVTSEKLYRASGRQVWFGQISVVVPTLWTNKDCGMQINYPGSGTPYKVERQIFNSQIDGQIYRYVDMQICRWIDILMYRYVDGQLYRYIDVQICRWIAIQICRWIAIQIFIWIDC